MNAARAIALSLLLLLASCGSDSSAENAAGSGGTSAGTVGNGGAAATGGIGGTSGAAGATGGTTVAGTGGTGAAGTSGGSGAGGVAGTSGTGGQSGAGGAEAGGGGGVETGGTTASGGGGQGGASGGAEGGAGAGGLGGAGVAGAGGDSAGGGAGGTSGGAAAFDRDAVMEIMRRVADYEIDRFGSGNDNGWVRAAFHTGMMAAYRALGDTKYRDYTRQWGQANSWQLHSDSNGLRFADNQACVQSYAELYLEDPTAQNDVMLAAAQTTFDTMVTSPEAGRDEWWWCDALFMAPPALARVAVAVDKPQYLTLMHEMYWDTTAFLYNPAQSLFWRDSSFVNTNTYWSRGNGWVVAGLARILEVLPESDSRRGDYENLLTEMATKLVTIQASDGFWRSSLTQPNAYNNPESSGTAFFCFGIAWGIHHGVLDRATFLPTVEKAWEALGTAVNSQGRLGWVQAVGAQPGPATMDSTNDYATGAFLLAGSEILEL